MEFKKTEKLIALIVGGIIVLIPMIFFLISLTKKISEKEEMPLGIG